MYIHPHSLHDQAFVAWRSPGRFTKNPDLVQLPSGRLLFVYSDTDAHWSQINQVLTLVASDDGGKSWYKFAEVAEANLQRGDERLVTPASACSRTEGSSCCAITTTTRISMRTNLRATGRGGATMAARRGVSIR